MCDVVSEQANKRARDWGVCLCVSVCVCACVHVRVSAQTGFKGGRNSLISALGSSQIASRIHVVGFQHRILRSREFYGADMILAAC